MANPVIHSAVLADNTVEPGDTLQLTVKYSDADNSTTTETTTITGTDEDGNSAVVTVSRTVVTTDVVTLLVTDSAGVEFEQVSTSGPDASGVFTAVFTGTA